MRRVLPLALALAAPLALVQPAAAGWYRFAPYVDIAAYPPPSLKTIRRAAGLRAATLGFVTAKEGRSCTPTWGGYAQYPATGRRAYRLADVRAFKRAGAGAVPSFGGQAGTELASVCSTPTALAKAYAGVIRTYGASHIDFDIEGATVTDRAVNDRRAKAIASLQRSARKRGKRLRVAFTLPVLPSGLDGSATALLRNAKANGVRVDLVNVMAMDYGEQAAPAPDGKMGSYAVASGTAARRQLARIFGARGASERLGVTPMIGINDVQTEVFGLTDAAQLTRWASVQRIGMVGMWQLSRDSACAKPAVTTQLNCSGVDQPRWAFARALGR